MKISFKGDYALKIILDLALHFDRGTIPIKEISKRQDIPERFLEQIVTMLKGAGYVKTVRGPRGGMIFTRSPEHAKKVNRRIFPGIQGGPLMHVIAAKAAAFGEALTPQFRAYQQAVADNAKTLAAVLVEQGLAIVTGGTDSHLMLVDLRPKRVTGKAAEASLDRAHITANKNAIPFDPEKPAITSGLRLGTPAATTRGFGAAEFAEVGRMIGEVLEGLSNSNDGTNTAAERAVGERVLALCGRFPIYPREGS